MSVNREQILLAMQNALLGEISPALRSVSVKFSGDAIHFDAYFHGEIAPEDWESMSCVETELIALMPEDIITSHSNHRIDFPEVLPKCDPLVYSRREY